MASNPTLGERVARAACEMGDFLDPEKPNLLTINKNDLQAIVDEPLRPILPSRIDTDGGFMSKVVLDGSGVIVFMALTPEYMADADAWREAKCFTASEPRMATFPNVQWRRADPPAVSRLRIRHRGFPKEGARG